MTPLEAAKALAATPPTYDAGSGTVEECRCSHCKEHASRPHLSDCPQLAIPQIVKALESAGALEGRPCPCPDGYCFFCGAHVMTPGDDDHAEDCPWVGLMQAIGSPFWPARG